jgi:hypothetical protein
MAQNMVRFFFLKILPRPASDKHSKNERMLSDDLIASEQEKKAFVIERKPINGQQRPKVTTPKPVNGQQSLKSPTPTEEAPKIPVSDSRWVALRRCLLVLAPIPITAALITFQFVHVIYISAGDRYISEVQNALQLAAGLRYSHCGFGDCNSATQNSI